MLSEFALTRLAVLRRLPFFVFALLMISGFCLENGWGQSASSQTSSKPAEAEATLFPVPDFTGDIWKRAKLTGDWGGLRSTMTRSGVQLDVDNVHTFQNVLSGGVDTTGRYIGTGEIVLKLDSRKMGLWSGGFLLVRGEAAFGNGVNPDTGAFLPVNTRPILALPARDEMVLSHVVLTQFLHEKFGVALEN